MNSKKRTLASLCPSDSIVFEPEECDHSQEKLIVDRIVRSYPSRVLVHSRSGYSVNGKPVFNENILAILNPSGEENIEGLPGKYDIIHPKRIQEIQERRKGK